MGVDHTFPFHIKDDDLDASVNVSTFAMSFLVKRFPEDADNAALITKTTSSGITVAGTFNATPASNAQRVSVAVLDTDTTPSSTLQPCLAHWELKRTDAGLEVVMAYGRMDLQQAVHLA